MAYPTVGQIRQRVLRQLRQNTGADVEQYTQPLIYEAIQAIFEQLVNKHKWDHLYTWETRTLDGITGLVTVPFTGVRRAMDVDIVRLQGQDIAIPSPVGTEHLLYTGSEALAVEELRWDHPDHDTKLFQFWPKTANSTIEFHISYIPTDFTDDDAVVPMDVSLMVNGAAWWMLADDGLNPASAEKAQVLYDTTFGDIMGRVGAKSYGFGRGRTDGRTVYLS